MTAAAYGHRPVDSETWWLSPYEFTMQWEIRPTRVPHTLREWESTVPEDWDVTVTQAGMQKLESAAPHAPLHLKPGSHYTIRLTGHKDRVLFPAKAETAALRHNWYLHRRCRPRCPHFGRTPVPQGFAENVERNAKLLSGVDFKRNDCYAQRTVLGQLAGRTHLMGRFLAGLAAALAVRRHEAIRRKFPVRFPRASSRRSRQ